MALRAKSMVASVNNSSSSFSNSSDNTQNWSRPMSMSTEVALTKHTLRRAFQAHFVLITALLTKVLLLDYMGLFAELVQRPHLPQWYMFQWSYICSMAVHLIAEMAINANSMVLMFVYVCALFVFALSPLLLAEIEVLWDFNLIITTNLDRRDLLVFFGHQCFTLVAFIVHFLHVSKAINLAKVWSVDQYSKDT